MHIGEQARRTPEKAAFVNATSGDTVTFAQLDERSNRLAQCLHRRGLRRGDGLCVLMENNIHYSEVCWAAIRSGLYLTPINRYLTADEAAYIVNDCGAKAIVTTVFIKQLAEQMTARISGCPVRLIIGGTAEGWQSYEDTVRDMPSGPLAEEWAGEVMLYSSGTTGRPKGIKPALPDYRLGEQPPRWAAAPRVYNFDDNTVYLSPAPHYFSAPTIFCMATQLMGGTAVFMERFDARLALDALRQYRITHSQWVPTMFIRMLKLGDAVRASYSFPDLRCAILAAAPCPAEVKRAMIDWWGPVIEEYYGASEINGLTRITSAETLVKPGSVGRPHLGILHICDEDGHECPVGTPGMIYFERDTVVFTYHNDPQKTRSSQHPAHETWSAVGDIGYVDEDNYLYLTDRKAFMIISGGVNIYPQAIENAIVLHPKVVDVAVFGVPNEELGEEVKAVIEPLPEVAPSPALATEIMDFISDKIARYMLPRSIDFTDALPRLPTGKLYKTKLRAQYWPS